MSSQVSQVGGGTSSQVAAIGIGLGGGRARGQGLWGTQEEQSLGLRSKRERWMQEGGRQGSGQE